MIVQCVCACMCVCVRACMCTGSDRKYVLMRLGFICLVLYWCHFVLSLHFSTGADPEAHTHWTPLMVACENDHREVANLLLEHGEQLQYCNVWQFLVY